MPSVMTTSMPEVVTPPCRRAAAIPANGISLWRTRAARVTVSVSSAFHASRDGIRWRSSMGSAGERNRARAWPDSYSCMTVSGICQDGDAIRTSRTAASAAHRAPRPACRPPASPVCVTPGAPPLCSGPCHTSHRDHGRRGRPGDMPRSCLTFVTLGVFSPARLAEAVPRMADCRSCSVERRCCAPPVGRTGSESHSTRRLNCRKAALGRTYGNLSGSVSGVQARRPVGVHAPRSCGCFRAGRVPRT